MVSRLLRKPLPERIHVLDFFDRLIEESIRYNISFYFLGSRADIVRKAAENLKKIFPGVEVKGFHNGYFDYEEERRVINEINKLRPNVLIIGMGVPKQEKWVDKHLSELGVNLCRIIGGAFDNLSGGIKKTTQMDVRYRFCMAIQIIPRTKKIMEEILNRYSPVQ